MKRWKSILAVVAIFLAGTVSAQTKWKVDKVHSSVRFSVTHMTISEVEGTFKTWDGTIENTKPDFTDAKIAFTIDVNSITTENENRDNHLKSDDFFNAAKFPAIKFESTTMQSLGNNKYKLNGNLTIRDITKPVSFDVTYGGTLTGSRGTKAGFKATTTIDRMAYGLKWDRATEAGGLVVGKDVEVTIKLELDQIK
ncbi:YceI family protein [Flavihumibacter profundi]|jgi:polyisoprenoid-binding protein YceI|uniref:YceI family protein n=1 Tax=Flavihumibacter profundi TaxID=2716883 RepID=UPI001CC63B16|nr:YceI family protein [Flavihumibacter profundi]MBZ5857495.1 YceI family protein [Flavihumibacter profundi]